MSNAVMYASFLDELTKIGASKHRMAVPQARSGRRSMRVDTMLKKDKDGTLFKKAYKLQGSLTYQGLPIAIEHQKGSVRSGVDTDGKPWKTTFKVPYGYIKNTEGKDGEEIDAYVGPEKGAPVAFVVHQHKADGKGHDEDKVMLGFKSKDEAKQMYLDHYNDKKFLGPISTIQVDELKRRLEEKRKHVKIASDAPRPGDVPSRDGRTPGPEKVEDGRNYVHTVPTAGAVYSSDTGATTRL